MAKEVIEKLEEQLNCSVCLDTYTNPKLLQCFHVYCQGCLVRLVVRDLQGQDSITCPICRQVTPIDPTKGVRGLQAAFHINRLLEIQDTVKKIQDLPPIRKLVRDSSTDEAPLVSPGPVKYCLEHEEEELKLYCDTCKDLICCECAIKGGKHHDHDYESIKSAFKLYKQEMTSSLKPLEEQLTAIKKALVQIDEVCSQISHQRETVEADIHNEVRKLHEILDARKTELIQELHQKTQGKLKSLAAQRDRIETLQARLDSCLEFIKKSLTTANQGDVLLMKAPMVKQVNELSTTFQTDVLKPTADADVTFSLSTDITTMCKRYGKLLRLGSESQDRLKSRSASIGLGLVPRTPAWHRESPNLKKTSSLNLEEFLSSSNLREDHDGDNAAVPDRETLQEGLLDAVKRGNLKKVKDFHNKGANLIATDQKGWTPLHHAARLDKREVVLYIVNNIPQEGLDILEGEKLQTALHKAAWYGDLEVCKILIENGASLNRLDYQGSNIYDKAVQSGNEELQKYIKSKHEDNKLTEDEIPIWRKL